ncbi:NAD(P) transhydrogenase subunit alpha [Gammaproteobacteria bacterium]|nr:NAD(P) transhydrogenase subunit alpha [Gammaproteobacteria bacterium]
MLIGIPKEADNLESRISVNPETVKLLTNLGFKVLLESSLGKGLYIHDKVFELNGAIICSSHNEILKKSDIVIRVGVSSAKEINLLKKDSLLISFFDPFTNEKMVQQFVDKSISSISMDMMPRISSAQKMDALSSQTNLSGYAAVILAANYYNKILPMMITAAGTIMPAKIFIIGVGVAGLQAIATAKRLGADVYAFDTRPAVEEQVKSLAAKFVKINIGEMNQTKSGHAIELTPEQLAKQQELIKKTCAKSNIIITTAQVFGKKAPLLITKDTISTMQPGSIIVDMAVANGGNVEGSKVDQVIDVNGVQIIAGNRLANKYALDSTNLYANNIFSLIEKLIDAQQNKIILDNKNEIVSSCLVTHNGEIVHTLVKKFLEG